MPPTTSDQEPGTRRTRTPYIPLPPQGIDGSDMRAKKPPALSFLLRMETLRRVARIGSLVAIDLAGVFLAIFTAIALKAQLRGDFDADQVWHGTKDVYAFACLVTVLLFARSGLYAGRAERPGLTRIVASLFQVAVVALIFAVVNGERFSSYYVFYGSLLFAVFYISSIRMLYERATGWLLRLAGYQRRAVIVGTGAHIEAVAHALAGSPQIAPIGFVSLTPRPENGLKDFGPLETLEDRFEANSIDEVL